MPYEKLLQDLPQPITPWETSYEPAKPEGPGFADTFKAAWGQETIWQQRQTFPVDPTYNPFDDADAADVPDVIKERSFSKAELDYNREQYAVEQQRRKTVEDGSWLGGVAGNLAADVTNPFYWPGFAVAPVRVGQAIALEVAGGTASELHKQNVQYNRTTTESVLNVALPTALVGALGGYAKYANKKLLQTAVADAAATVGRAADAGAAQVRDVVTPAGEASLPGTPPTMPGVASVHAQALNDPLMPPKLKDDIRAVQYSSIQPAKVREGKAVPTGALDRAEQVTAQDLTFVDATIKQGYIAHRKAGGTLTKQQFGEEVTRALRRNGSRNAAAYQTAAALAERMATRADDWVMLGMFKNTDEALAEMVSRAEAAGVKPPRPSRVLRAKGAAGYFPRVYRLQGLADLEVLAKTKALFKQKLLDAAATNAHGAVRVVGINPQRIPLPNGGTTTRYESFVTVQPGRDVADELGDTLIEQGKRPDAWEYIDTATLREQADAIVESILDNMRGGVDITDPDYQFPLPGSVKERTLTFVTDEELDALGLLENDPMGVLAKHFAQMHREAELQRALGGRKLAENWQEYRSWYLDQIQAAEKAGDADKVGKLRTAMEKAQRLVQQVDSLIYEKLDKPQAVAQLANNFTNYLQMANTFVALPAVSISSLTEAVTPAIRNGVMNQLAGWVDVIRGAARGDWPEFKRFANDLGLAAQVVEGQAGSRIAALSGEELRHSQSIAMQTFFKLTGLPYITNLFEVVGLLGWQRQSTRLMERVAAGKASTKDLALLADVGIGKDDAAAILRNLQQHGQQVPGYKATQPNTHKWDDANLARRYESALFNGVRATILHPGKLDVPGWQNSKNSLFRLASQFMRHPYASVDRFATAGLQRRDATYLAGASTMLALAAVVELGKSTVQGEDITERTLADLALGTLDRSSLLGIYGSVANAAYHGATGTPRGRYAMREPWQVVTGPGPAATYQYATAAIRAAVSGEDKDLWKAARIFNFYHLVDMLHLAQEGYGYREK